MQEDAVSVDRAKYSNCMGLLDKKVEYDKKTRHGGLSEYLYRVSNELRSLLRESVPYVKICRYNPKHLCPNLNGYGDNGQRSLKL
jgi:hypothetical protein